MNPKEAIHLDEDQLIRAVVDEVDLPPPLRDHLSVCPSCRAQKERFEKQLAQLAQMAERFSPSPKRRVTLPVEDSRGMRWRFWGWRGTLVTALSAAVVILVVSWSILVRTTPEGGMAILTREIWEDEQLMSEIRVLEENPLSQLYLDISGGSYRGFDEEFMEFVVPPVEDDTLSHDVGEGGAALC